MPTTKKRVPAVDGWFRIEPEPCLVGSRCTACGTIAFPAESSYCRNPECDGGEFEAADLSRRGRIWSYTDARYQPPPPYVAADPYEPFALAAVELLQEKMVVMGQVASGISASELSIGDEVELIVETLYSDDDTDYLVWKWRPAGAR